MRFPILLCYRTIPWLLLLSPLLWSGGAIAYVGPGAGLSFLGSAIAIILVVLVALVGLVVAPLRYYRRLKKSNTSTPPEEKSPPGS